jgi:ribosomal protein S6
MENTIALISVFIGVAALAVLLLVAWGLCELVYYIKDKRHQKWGAWVFENYPELMPLLEEYMRTSNNVAYTVSEQYKLKEEINKQAEENKYLPKGDRIDAYIETLKEKYKWLDDLRKEQYVEKELAYKKLELFWETNFPNLKEEKRIMWWGW